MGVFELVATLALDSSQYDAGLDEGEQKAHGFGGKLKAVLGGAAAVGVGAVAAIGSATAAMGATLIKQTGNVAAYGDNIDKMSQKMGMTAQAYQEWDAVMQHSGTSMETMKASMKTLANAAETGSDAFEKLGISQKELQTLSQEQLFERTISALQNVEDETQRTYLAGKTLGRGATELGALLNTSAEDTQAMRDRVRELGGVMSDDAVKAAATYQDSLQDMQTAISGVSRGIVSGFLPSVTKIMDGITEIFGGDGDKGVTLVSEGVDALLDKVDETIPKVMDVGGKIVSAFSTAIIDNLPDIASQGTELVISLATSVISSLPTVFETGVSVVEAIFNAIVESLPMLEEAGTQFFDKGVQLVTQIAGGIGDNIPLILQKVGEVIINILQRLLQAAPSIMAAGVRIISSLAGGIARNIPQILTTIVSLVVRIAATILQNLPRILQTGLELIGQLAAGVVRGVPKLIGQIPKILQSIAKSFTSFNWAGIGSQVISGIANGIKNGIGKIASAAKDAAKSAFNAAKNFLGIKSPSRLFRDKIGAMMAKGMEIGFEQEFDPDDYADAIESIRDIGGDYSADVDRESVTIEKQEDTDLVDEIRRLYNAIMGLQIVLDTGEVVGAVVDPINQALGRKAVIAGRS